MFALFKNFSFFLYMSIKIYSNKFYELIKFKVTDLKHFFIYKKKLKICNCYVK